MAKTPRSQPGSIGSLSYKPTSDEGLVPKTLEFIQSQLSKWRDDPNRPQDDSEKLLNPSLCSFLSRIALNEFPMAFFQHEDPQAKTRTVDIGVHSRADNTIIGAKSYTSYEAFLVIECKRLPTPSKARGQEYVSGTNAISGSATGGIQRFKLRLHGASIETAVMVGYIQEGSHRGWYTKINKWIAQLIVKPSSDGILWESLDLLQNFQSDNKQKTSQAESSHKRINSHHSGEIKLHHFWVMMKQKPST